MKKVRVNLKEKFPNYFAATERTDELAELSEDQVSNLEKIEEKFAAMNGEIEELKKRPEVADESEDPKKTEAKAEVKKDAAEKVEDDRFAAITAEIASLKELIAKKPASEATVVDGDDPKDQSGKNENKYATSVDLEMERLFKKK